MRVMLMVQNDGDKRPKCASWWPAGSGPKSFEDVQQRTSIGTVADTCWDGRPIWLVEAESAEAARLVIWCSKNTGTFTNQGRILASGGRS